MMKNDDLVGKCKRRVYFFIEFIWMLFLYKFDSTYIKSLIISSTFVRKSETTAQKETRSQLNYHDALTLSVFT